VASLLEQKARQQEKEKNEEGKKYQVVD